MEATSFITETLKEVSPFRIADSIGEGPRYVGKREGWMFKMPSGSKRSKTSCLMITPKEAKMPWSSPFLSADLRRLTSSRSDFSRA